jgi:hypothetical protein
VYKMSIRNPKRKSPIKRTGRSGRIMLKCAGADWIHPVQDRDRWLALVNTVMGLHVCIENRELLYQLSDCCLVKE